MTEAAVAEAKKDPVATIAGHMPHLSTGDRAALRRMMLTKGKSADGVVLGLMHAAALPDAEWRSPASFRRWKMVAHVAATLSGTAGDNPHKPGQAVGAALHAAHYSEHRLMRLTTARGSPLIDQIVRAARFLKQAGSTAVDLRTFNDLLSDRADIADGARLRLARDYYNAAYKAKS